MRAETSSSSLDYHDLYDWESTQTRMARFAVGEVSARMIGKLHSDVWSLHGTNVLQPRKLWLKCPVCQQRQGSGGGKIASVWMRLIIPKEIQSWSHGSSSWCVSASAITEGGKTKSLVFFMFSWEVAACPHPWKCIILSVCYCDVFINVVKVTENTFKILKPPLLRVCVRLVVSPVLLNRCELMNI